MRYITDADRGLKALTESLGEYMLNVDGRTTIEELKARVVLYERCVKLIQKADSLSKYLHSSSSNIDASSLESIVGKEPI